MSSNLLKDTSYSTILKVSAPMMFSALSGSLMQIIDRMILAHYSELAMTSANAASAWCSTIQCSMISIIFIAGAFVGNYNGAGKYKFASVPVWQMLWFSLSLFLISFPISNFLGSYCVPKNLQADGIPFFKTLFAWTPLFCMRASISLFFISIGKGYIVTIAVLIALVVNCFTATILVFGYCGITQFMGTSGAAIGTIIGAFADLIFLAICFFSKQIRTKYNTLYCKFRPRRLKRYLKLGFLASIGHIIESCIYSFLVFFLSGVNNEMALIQTISTTLYSFFLFSISGLEKGVMSIASNLLGAKMRSSIDTLFKHTIILQLTIAVVVSILIFSCPSIFIGSFVDINTINPDLLHQIVVALSLMMITFLFDGIIWIEAGILEAGGDVNYMMASIAGNQVLFIAIPMAFLVYNNCFNVSWSWNLYSIASAVSSVILYKRYKSDKWIHINV